MMELLGLSEAESRQPEEFILLVVSSYTESLPTVINISENKDMDGTTVTEGCEHNRTKERTLYIF